MRLQTNKLTAGKSQSEGKTNQKYLQSLNDSSKLEKLDDISKRVKEMNNGLQEKLKIVNMYDRQYKIQIIKKAMLAAKLKQQFEITL